VSVFVTGIGVVSPIGLNVDENLNALKSGISGIRKSSDHNLMIGEVDMTNEQISRHLNLPEEDFSRTTLLALMASKEAWQNKTHNSSIRTGLISSTSAGGLDRMEKYYFESQRNPSSYTTDLMTHDNGRTTEKIAHELFINGYISTISTACSSGANAIMQGARLIKANKLDRVIVGGSDPITQFNIKGFSSLNIYDPEICKPFDESRKGLNLGEGAGFMILENEHSVSLTSSHPLCRLSGWNNSTDAFHQTASSANGKGAYLAMINALTKAKLAPEQINYINAHGTGTGNNDLSESIAIQKAFGAKIPPFSSTKGSTGHTLAAAGAIEAVFCVLAITSQSLFPNLNFSVPMKETGLIPETRFKPDTSVHHVLSNSFGFGGNCTSLIFSKIT
jgi:3-oxoacyl-(acyl-carrier-protein) synthase